jgi:TonB-dependent SusC/RagA subfamily outer membrane receptor
MIIIKNIKKRFSKTHFLILFLFFNAFVTYAQTSVTIKGIITDQSGDPVIGAIITAKADNTKKVLSDKDGNFTLAVPANNTVIVITSFGMLKKEVTASVQATNKIALEYESRTMNEVIVVGYGEQKKASVIGAITQTSGKDLERTGGVTSLGQALTGNLPGLTTSSSTGQPGAEDPQIVIRGVSTWNNSSPLILVDGVERSLSAIDISSVESVTVLKDASATAIYGVRGGNGVIIVTTKRGVEGKAQVQARSNVTTKIASKLPAKYDSYDALTIKNRIVERESIVDPNAWSGYTPMGLIYKYRYPADGAEADRYPNVDWEKELFKSSAQSYNTSVNVSGGGKAVKYFAGLDVTQDQPNAAFWLAYSGLEKRTATQLTTDFILNQDLGIITKGLSLTGTLSLDNSFLESGRGINDQFNNAQREYINPSNGLVSYEQPRNAGTQFDFNDAVAWATAAGSVDIRGTLRNFLYRGQLNYARSFGGNSVTALGVFQRTRNVTGSNFASYREEWAFRTTYNYKQRYFFEVNGAYNGSEKFGPDYRFALFPAVAAGWSINNENFMKNVNFVDVLKIRGSWGKVGDDSAGPRNLYNDAYSYGGNTQMGSPVSNTTYTIFRQSAIGSPTISWENSEKRNIGVDFSFFKGDIAGSVDVFRDHRTRIIIGGTGRAIPSFFGYGGLTPSANLGESTGKGYEAELKLGHSFSNGIRLTTNIAVTHATNLTIFRDDPGLTPSYQKQAGYAIGQTKSFINNGFIKSWDDLYGSSVRAANNQNRLPGDYNIVDFNADGIIDDKDQAPYGYSGTPQNTYNANFGFEFKRFSIFVQFYGVNNVTRQIQFPDFQGRSNVVFVEKPFYYAQDGGGEVPPPRWSVLDAQGGNGTRYAYDGSYIRLKNVEIGYGLPPKIINKLGIKTLRLYVNGNNLLLWTKMPDDRESNFSSAFGDSSSGAYPTLKRFNLGIDITL